VTETLDPAHDVLSAREATDRLLDHLGTLDDATVGRPSLLPGWTVGHVLAHIARNADGMVRLVDWAESGVPTPMYDSMEVRNADIEAGSVRPAAELVADVRDSAERLDAAFERLLDLPSAGADRLVLFGAQPPGTVPDVPAAELPLARLREVAIHHVDLGLPGFGPLDWPESFVARMSDFVDGRVGPVEVSGPAAAVLAWRLGRGDSGLVVGPDGSPPGDPGPW
jgi:maleylpyruvate isomerase